MSLWRQFHVFESSHPSFHRTIFLGAPLAFLPCSVAMGLCRRCVIFTSSCRRVFLSSTALHTWQVLDVWGHILYRLHLHKLYLPFFALYLVTLLPCCYLVTLLLCYLVTMLPCYSETRSVTLLLLYRLYLHKLYLPFFAWYLVVCYPVTLLPCYLVTHSIPHKAEV